MKKYITEENFTYNFSAYNDFNALNRAAQTSTKFAQLLNGNELSKLLTADWRSWEKLGEDCVWMRSL